MSSIVLKTAKRNTTVNRALVRSAVTGAFGTVARRSGAGTKAVRKAGRPASKKAA